MYLNGLRYITRDLTELRRMSLRDYDLHMDAYRLREYDRLNRIIDEAFIMRKMNQVKKDKYVITDPKQLNADAKREADRILGIKSKRERAINERLERIARNLEEYRRLKEKE